MPSSDKELQRQRIKHTIEVLGIDNSFMNGGDSIIYHYTNCEAAALILGNGTLRFGDPSLFDDKRDMDSTIIEFEADKSTYIQTTLRATPDISYNNLLKLSKAHPEFFIEAAREILNKQKKNSGVICFSENSDNAYLWENYGAKDKGVCIGIRLSALRKCLVSKVKYSPSMLKANFYDKSIEAYVYWALVKSTKYDKENEIRAFCLNVHEHCDDNRCMPLDKNLVDEIYFGVNTTQIEIESLINLLKIKNYPKQMKLYQMVDNHDDYGYSEPKSIAT